MHKVFFLLLVLAAGTWAAPAQTTIDSVNKYAYGANIGWIDGRGDVANGAAIGEYVCSGYIYGANVGWISLGSGAPVNGIQYQNNSATDWGVNLDSLGNLRGYAYGANLGWISFESLGDPKLDLVTGTLTGYAWSANCGWISLSNTTASVQTGTFLGVTSYAGSVLVNWPLPPLRWDSDNDWVLQSTESLAATPVVWQDIAPPYGHIPGGVWYYSEAASGARYYRLHKP